MRSINSVCKFTGVFAPAVLLAFFYHPELNVVLFFMCMLLLVVSRVKLKSLILFLIPIVIIAAGMFVTGMQFGSDANLGAQQGLFTDRAVYNGLQLSSRILVFAGFGMLFFFTTDRIEFVKDVGQQLKIKPKFTYGILAAWGMMPNLRYEYKKTRSAFYARGLRPLAVSPKLIVPMLVKAVRWSEALAMAMESKGFSESAKRTYYKTIKLKARDIVFPAVTLAVTIVGLVLL